MSKICANKSCKCPPLQIIYICNLCKKCQECCECYIVDDFNKEGYDF